MSDKQSKSSSHGSKEEEKRSNSDEEKRSQSEEGETTTKKDKYDRSGPHPIIGLIIFLVLQFIAIVLLTVATPLEWFKIKASYGAQLYGSGVTKPVCVTAWGMRHGCGSKHYLDRSFTHTFCYRVRIDFKLVEAFCIMSLGFMVFAFILGIASCMQKASKMAVGGLAGLAMLCALIPWGIVAGMYYQKPCCNTRDWLTVPVKTCTYENSRMAGQDVPPFKDMGKYGSAFGLSVTAWALEFLAVIFAVIPFF